MTPEHKKALLEGAARARAAKKAQQQNVPRITKPKPGSQQVLSTPENVGAAADLAQALGPEPANIPDVNIPQSQAEPDPNKPETIPVNYLSGFVRRLEVFGDKPGFVRRWFNDDKGGSNIAAALASGWRFSERQEVQLNAAVTPRNADLGSRVQEVVGTNENGSPLFAYLMEIPEWLFNKHQEARIAYHNQLRSQMKAGTLGAKAGDGRYSSANPPPGGTRLPAISMDTKLRTR